MIRAMLTTALMLVLSAEAMAQTPEVIEGLEFQLQALRQTDAAVKARAEAALKATEVEKLSAEIAALNARLAALQKMKAEAAVNAKVEAEFKLRAAADADAKAAQKALVKPADKPTEGRQLQIIRALVNNESADSGVVMLNRKTFKLPADKLAALNGFLTANVKGVVLETKVEGDTMTVTTTPEVMKTLSGLVDLMNGGKKVVIWQAAPKLDGTVDVTGRVEFDIDIQTPKFDKFDVKPVLELAPKIYRVITGESKTVPAVPKVPAVLKVIEAPKPPAGPVELKLRVISPPKPTVVPEKPAAPEVPAPKPERK